MVSKVQPNYIDNLPLKGILQKINYSPSLCYSKANVIFG